MSSTTLQRVLDVLNDSAGLSDPRMDKFLMKSPLQLIIIITLYLSTIFKFGPSFMKNRKPYSLRRVMIVYNIFQIVINTVLFIITFSEVRKLSVACSPYETTNSEENLQQLRLHYFYILLKYFDLVETVFYVLRKKEGQVSFLHVYHHIGILVAAWISGKYFPGGQALFVEFYNTLVHAIMYCYYLVTSWKRSTTKAIWWKKYLTALQIVQHCLVFMSVFPAVVNANCSYPKGWMGAFSLNVLFIIYLFGRFYKNAYLKKTV